MLELSCGLATPSRTPCLGVILARRRADGVLDWHRGRVVLATIVITEDRCGIRELYSGAELLRSFEEAAYHSPVWCEGVLQAIRVASQFVFRLDQQYRLTEVGWFVRSLFRSADSFGTSPSGEGR